MSYLLGNMDTVIALAGEHLRIVGFAVLLATAIGVPVGLLIARVQWLAPWVLATTGIFYLIPSLALFAMIIPFTGLGASTAIIGLVLYALLPIVRNTATGMVNVDPALVEAARGMGMTRAQRLILLELPVAAPAIVAGLRVAAVMSVGVATIAAYVGAGGLGTIIFRGMQLFYPEMVVAGALPAALMAIAVDLAFIVLERHFEVRTGKRIPRRERRAGDARMPSAKDGRGEVASA